jgi:hypothetical protein
LKSTRELYYYCDDCMQFHEHGSHKLVNRKLCFICHKIQPKKTKVVEDNLNGKMQLCDKCYDEYEMIMY